MNVSVILGHPYKKSFNHAIARAVTTSLEACGHTVFFHDLYEEGFDPVLTGFELAAGKPKDALTKRHCGEIKEADGIVVIHPNWWGQPPALLKGWVDRVLRQGTAYLFDEGDDGSGIPEGLLKAKTAVVFNTSNTPEEREEAVFKDPLDTLWKNCIFGFCGVGNCQRKMFRVIAGSSETQRQAWLMETGEIIRRYFTRQ